MAADSVSTNIFGASVPTSTGTAGSPSANGSPNFLDPTGDATSDPASGVSASAGTGSVGYFPGVGPREDSADLYRPSSFGASNPTATGAGDGTPNHNHTGV
jgi:hypothetical protein